MNIRSIVRAAQYTLLASVVFLGGCAGGGKSFELHTNQWQGRSLTELKQAMSRPESYASKIHWKEQTYPLNNGNFVFVEPYDPTCTIKWEVTQGGYILKYTTEGSGCKDEESEAPTRTEPLRW